MKTKTATEARQLENWTARKTQRKEWQRQLDSKKDCRQAAEEAGEAGEVEAEEVEVVGVEEVKLAKVMGSGHLWILKLIDRRVEEEEDRRQRELRERGRRETEVAERQRKTTLRWR